MRGATTAEASVSVATWSTTTRSRAASSGSRASPSANGRLEGLRAPVDQGVHQLGEELALVLHERSSRSSARMTRCAATPLSTAISSRVVPGTTRSAA